MDNMNVCNGALMRLGDMIRPSMSINKEIVAAQDAAELGELFDASFNARVGVLSKNKEELDRLIKIAERLLLAIPKEKLPYVNFIIVDNNMDLRNEVFASPQQGKEELSEEQIKKIRHSGLLFLNQVVQKGCITYAHFKNKDWNKDELRNELEKMKDYILRAGIADETGAEVKTKKPLQPLLFSKKKGPEHKDDDGVYVPHLGSFEDANDDITKVESDDESKEKDDRAKLLFTAPRAREDSLPSDLIKTGNDEAKPTYSFLDLLAADGFETNDLEHFEEQVILKLDKLKQHILHQFNPVFNELNSVRKRLRILAEQTIEKNLDRKSIMK